MNQQRYRLVFNRCRNLLMAVAETASSQGKAPGSTTGRAGSASAAASPAPMLRLRALPFAAMLSMGLSFLLAVPFAAAQQTPDRSAPADQQATVINAANGVPLVNITAPKDGLSHNKFWQFDVGPQGVILNNGNRPSNTQLGGWVQANPNLVKGTARIILNEVNAITASQLRGYMEVAGDNAQVIVANPAGITCDGCGFINANRITLTTGAPVLGADGSLEGFRVQGGVINIGGKGMDSSQADFTDLITRSLQVNAGIWANSLKITTGLNQVSADHSQISPITDANGNVPEYAVDVGQLGGMYAGKIMLIGTEAGVGMRNAGQIGASAGDIVITASGQLQNRGSINSSGNLMLNAGAGIDNSGVVMARGNAQLSSGGDIDNSGSIVAMGNTVLNAGGQINSGAGSVLAAGMKDDGSIGNSGNLQLTGKGKITALGRNLAGGDLSMNGSALDLAGSQTSGNNISLNAAEGDIDASDATVIARKQLSASTSGTLRTDRAAIAGGRLDLRAKDLSNLNGYVLQSDSSGDSNITLSGKLSNGKGRIGSNGGLKISARSIDNQAGSIVAAQAMALDSSSLDNRGGQIQAQGDLTIRSGSIDNTSSLIRSGATLDIQADSVVNRDTQGRDQGLEGKSVRIDADQIDNSGGAIRANDALTIISAGKLNNDNGVISSQNSVTIQDRDATARKLEISNSKGVIIAANNLRMDSVKLGGDGKLLSKGDMAISVDGDFNNTGTLQADGDLAFSSGGKLSNQSLIRAGKTLNLEAANIDNSKGAEISAQTTRIKTAGTLNNRGQINGGKTRVQADTLNNLGSGRIYGDQVALAANILNNDKEDNVAAVVGARERLDIGAVTINNRDHSTLYSKGDMAIGGALDGDDHAIGSATTLNNESATIDAAGNLDIAAKTINNRDIYFTTIEEVQGGDFTGAAYSFDGQNWIEAAKNPRIFVVGGISYLLTDDNPTPTAGVNDNFYSLAGGLTTTRTEVGTSDPGKIQSGGNMRLKADTILNDKSQITAGGSLDSGSTAINNTTVTGHDKVVLGGASTHYYATSETKTGEDNEEYVVYTQHKDDNGQAGIVFSDKTFTLSPSSSKDKTAPTPSGTFIAERKTDGVNAAIDAAAAAVTPIGTIDKQVDQQLDRKKMFLGNPDSELSYPIETDPKYTEYGRWLASNYMLQQLGFDPSYMQKYLGDEYFAQRLVREQIIQLRGQQGLGDYASDQARYRALLNNGVTFAKTWNLRPGVALSPAQMAQLTSDIVWLVQEDVTQADGKPGQMLLPQVYLRVRDGDLHADGKLIAPQPLSFKPSGNGADQGSIAGRTVVTLDHADMQGLIRQLGSKPVAGLYGRPEHAVE
ncbi:filamentous hemagglutinin N-terminal domain-containing protein [Collimonas sp.]|jgi:filamentous hemagglutinin|uniref:two-partner secretion domain-containing protein n=1 Tax=Collimonas sp. TaxID=1963772 RepID=UPI002C0AD0E1|nr:filamentous hemagglutinin N-terminal domain-containing protein [Collimonas sp.]HWW07562.1 filamentous hemagglutinin N-terminal domain-containing protein [Collimonas sp.]